jgi:putative ABC transport system ATP-binding protein
LIIRDNLKILLKDFRFTVFKYKFGIFLLSLKVNGSMENMIIIRNLVKNYKVGTIVVRALRSISVDIKRNEYVAIMGPSGSGKSTLMNIIGCLDTPTGGQYVLNNTDVSKLEDNQLAEIRNKEIGFVFQTFNLLPRYTAFENVMLPLVYAGKSKAERIRRASEVMESVGLTDRATHKPNELSGGQRQRVAVARALVNNPSIILADEPTGNLDSKTSIDIMALFHEIHQKGNTIILVTHEEDIARHAHRIIRLRDGEIESDRVNENPVKVTAPVSLE